MNALLNITERLPNPLGIDLVRYDLARRGVSAASEPRAKLKLSAILGEAGFDEVHLSAMGQSPMPRNAKSLALRHGRPQVLDVHIVPQVTWFAAL
jgi:hypothetical protein